MAIETIERLHYYEDQYLGVDDFDLEQEYFRNLARRHVLGHHTWGIVVGFDLLEQKKLGGEPGVDIFISPGMAIDGFGRQIVLFEPYALPEELFASYVYNPGAQDGEWIPLWLAYCEEKNKPPRPGYGQCDGGDQTAHVRESFRLFTGKLTEQQQRTPIVVTDGGGQAPASLPDGSVPYQALANTDRARWLIPLGQVRWLAKQAPNQAGDYFVETKPEEKAKAREGRQYVGNVTSAILAPAGALRIADRATDVLSPDPTDPKYAGVAVKLEGSLEVDRVLVAKENEEIHGGQLIFKNTAGKDENIPLWLQRTTSNAGATTDLRIHIGDQTDAAGTRLTVGPKSGADEKVVLAVRANDGVEIPTGTLEFGKDQRQMLNLKTVLDGKYWYGIGVQNQTLYFRSEGEFRWFKGGAHNDDPENAANGTLQLRLDDQARLHFGEQVRQMLNLWKEEYGIGVQGSTLYFRSAADFCWFRGGIFSPNRSEPGAGGVLAMKLDDASTLGVAGRAGIGTFSPQVRLHVKGDCIRLEAADGHGSLDLRADGAALDIQTTGGPLYINNVNQNTYINAGGGQVGIGTDAPAAKLDVYGRILRHGQAFSVVGTADHGQVVAVPWGSCDDWNIFVSPKTMGEEEPDPEADNAMLMIECFATASTSTWQITARYKFKYWNDNPKNGVWNHGSANYILVPQ